MLLLKMGPEIPSRARRTVPALRRSEKEDGRRPSKFLVDIKTWNVRLASSWTDFLAPVVCWGTLQFI